MTPAPSLPFGQQLRRLRLAAGLSQEELAERAGLSARGVSDLERGRRVAPRPETVRLLADGLVIDAAERAALIAAARPELAPLTSVQAVPPAAASSIAADRRPSLGPTPLTRLVGRDADVAEVCALLRREEVRLLTLTGPGGVGKTRLALAAAADLATAERFADGVAFVELAPVRDPALVVPAVAAVLGVDGGDGRPLVDALKAELGRRRLLLVLDNFEHVLPAAALVAELLAACPSLAIMATSRERLHLRGERDTPVAPLALPASPDPTRSVPLADVAGASAVRLFVERAEDVRPGFALTPENAPAVAEICRRLDGLPLAIELAAPGLRVLSPAAFLERLGRRLPLVGGEARDLPARQQTLRATIAWSHDLLTPDEQGLFRSLSVFVGGFTLEAAEAVNGGLRTQDSGLSEQLVGPARSSVLSPQSSSVLDGVASLVDKSLLRAEQGPDGGAATDVRYAMLESVREFGLEQLTAHGEAAALRDRHARYVLALVEGTEPQAWAADHARWRARLGDEYANVRAALAWFEEIGATKNVLRLGGALGLFWHGHGPASEGQAWLERALARDDGPPTPVRTKGLYAAGLLAMRQGDLARAEALARQGLAQSEEIGDPWGAGGARFVLGQLALSNGDLAQARLHFDAARAAFASAGDDRYVSVALTSLGAEAVMAGDHARATALLEAAADRWRAVGSGLGVAWALFNLARVERARGDPRRAAALAHESLVLRAEAGEHAGIADALVGLASIAGLAGQPARAARLLAAADARYRANAAAFTAEVRASHVEAQAAARARLGERAFAAAWAEGGAMTLAEAVAEAAVVEREAGGPVPMEGGRSDAGAFGLSPREREVLRLLVAGRSDREIADTLFISPRTASKHVGAILAKLDAPSRTAAALRAARDDLA